MTDRRCKSRMMARPKSKFRLSAKTFRNFTIAEKYQS
jgi:hypothetical protein